MNCCKQLLLLAVALVQCAEGQTPADTDASRALAVISTVYGIVRVGLAIGTCMHSYMHTASCSVYLFVCVCIGKCTSCHREAPLLNVAKCNKHHRCKCGMCVN